MIHLPTWYLIHHDVWMMNIQLSFPWMQHQEISNFSTMQRFRSQDTTGCMLAAVMVTKLTANLMWTNCLATIIPKLLLDIGVSINYCERSKLSRNLLLVGGLPNKRKSSLHLLCKGIQW